MGLSAPRANSIEIIALQTVLKIDGLNQRELVYLGMTLNHHQ